MPFLPLLGLLSFAFAQDAPKQILVLTHTAGYRHDSISVAVDALRKIATDSSKFAITHTEDLTQISASNLASFDAVFFFTSGELELSPSQKSDLLDFVRNGKGFAGVHSASDTLYGWEDYGDMLGAYFDGHPWVHEATVTVEDTTFPGMQDLGPSFPFVEEFYQHRAFSRDKVKVLLSLDTKTIDLSLPGVNRTDNDFALAWYRSYGNGRVYYNALGHFDDTWKDPRFLRMIHGALLYLTGLAEPAPTPQP